MIKLVESWWTREKSIFDSRYVGELSLVLLAPELHTVRDTNKFDGDHQNVAALENPPSEDILGSQIPAGFGWIHIFAFVAKHRTSRHDSQMAEMRKVINEAFGDTVGEILSVGLTGRGEERQYWKGVAFHSSARIGRFRTVLALAEQIAQESI